MARRVTNVVFDIGGVLLDWQPSLADRDLIPDPDELAWFLDTICTADWNATLDAAEVNVGARGFGLPAHRFVGAADLEVALEAVGLL